MMNFTCMRMSLFDMAGFLLIIVEAKNVTV